MPSSSAARTSLRAATAAMGPGSDRRRWIRMWCGPSLRPWQRARAWPRKSSGARPQGAIAPRLQLAILTKRPWRRVDAARAPLQYRAQRTGFYRRKKPMISKRIFAAGVAALALAIAMAPRGASAQDAFKIGLILPMTGQQASTGKQIDAAVKLYMAQHGDSVGGKKIQVILKDDGAVPDNTKRIAQELIV